MRIPLTDFHIKALRNPRMHPGFTTVALEVARKEINELEQSLLYLDDESEIDGIVEDIAFIESLPGYTEEPTQ